MKTDSSSEFQALRKFLASWKMYKQSSYAPDAGFSVIGAVYKCFHKIIVRSPIEMTQMSSV